MDAYFLYYWYKLVKFVAMVRLAIALRIDKLSYDLYIKRCHKAINARYIPILKNLTNSYFEGILNTSNRKGDINIVLPEYALKFYNTDNPEEFIKKYGEVSRSLDKLNVKKAELLENVRQDKKVQYSSEKISEINVAVKYLLEK